MNASKIKEHIKDPNPRKKDLNLFLKIKLLIEDKAQGSESLTSGIQIPLGRIFKLQQRSRILELWIQIPQHANAFNAGQKCY